MFILAYVEFFQGKYMFINYKYTNLFKDFVAMCLYS